MPEKSPTVLRIAGIGAGLLGALLVRKVLDAAWRSASGHTAPDPDDRDAPLAEVIDKWLPTGKIGHVQINDPNLQGPGQGEVKFAPVFEALARNHYAFDVSMEPMKYVPDGPGSAARAIGYVKGILETLQHRKG